MSNPASDKLLAAERSKLAGMCKEQSQQIGALTAVLAGDSAGCWLVYGKTVIIGPDKHDIQEGFEIVNFNFHTNGNQPPLQNQRQLPGPTDAGMTTSQKTSAIG